MTKKSLRSTRRRLRTGPVPGEITVAWSSVIELLRASDANIEHYVDIFHEGPLSDRKVLSALVTSLDVTRDPTVESHILQALNHALVPFDGMPLARYTDRQPGNPHWHPAMCHAEPTDEFIAWLLEKLNGTWTSAPFMYPLASLAPADVALPVIEKYLDVSPPMVYSAWVICGGRTELDRMHAALDTPDYIARDHIHKCIRKLKRKLQRRPSFTI